MSFNTGIGAFQDWLIDQGQPVAFLLDDGVAELPSRPASVSKSSLFALQYTGYGESWYPEVGMPMSHGLRVVALGDGYGDGIWPGLGPSAGLDCWGSGGDT